MDMKRILQAMDGVASKPVAGVNDMAKFLKAVDSAEKAIPLVEAKSPHKVTLPIQMAMQHYQQPKPVTKSRNTGLLEKYYHQVEQEVNEEHEQEQAMRDQRIRMYSQRIAERVLMKESRTDEIAGAFPSPSTRAKWAADAAVSNAAEAKRQAALKAQADAERLKTNTELVDKEQKINHHSLDATIPADEGIFDNTPKVDFKTRAKELFAKGLTEQQVLQQLVKEGCPPNQAAVFVQGAQLEESPIDMTGDPNDPTIYGHATANPMSLKGRIQQARNQLKELANMAESDDLATWQKICQLSKGGMFIGLEQNIEQVRHGIEQLAAKRKQGGVASRGIDKTIGEDNDPCWKDYKQVGMKKKGGKTVPNCVPKE